MYKINLLDCTLRDGGYVNDWQFGKNAIKNIVQKLSKTGIEMIEVGFIKGNEYDANRSVFPDIKSFENIIDEKSVGVSYFGMLDMSSPVPKDRITPQVKTSIDGIRVIFKKDRQDLAFEYCQHVQAMGYQLFVNFVGTDQYTDKEFLEGLEKFSTLHPTGMTIVDTFGCIKKREFSRLVMLADNNMDQDIMLCYHAHNNLQQAFGNAELMIEMNLERDIGIDACVFGMGRGAGNLNLELFADLMNEKYGKNYLISPMLEIMDEYLDKFYRKNFWGYSLPLYLSASLKCHPNYAIYLAAKDTLSVKSFRELLSSISKDDRVIFKKEAADNYYRKYMENFVDDKNAINSLSHEMYGKEILLLTPGKSIRTCSANIKKETNRKDTIVWAVNFYDTEFNIDYIFVSNMRRLKQLGDVGKKKIICTSNISSDIKAEYILNYSSYISESESLVDNAGLMSLKILTALGVKKVKIAGMDGYTSIQAENYFNRKFEVYHPFDIENRNELMASELRRLMKHIEIELITPTRYVLCE